jgi:hypothetical protein
MLLPHVVYAAPGDDVRAAATAGRSGKRKGDLFEGRRKWSGLGGLGGFRGFGVELISVITLRGLHPWTKYDVYVVKAKFSSWTRTRLSLSTDCSIGCAAEARRIRDAGKVLASRTHWTPQPRCMTSQERRRSTGHVGEAGHLGSNAISLA